MLRRESQQVPDELHQKNTYQNCQFGPIFFALLIHACAADFGVGAFVTLRPFACFFWEVSPGGPLGSLGVSLGLLGSRRLGGPDEIVTPVGFKCCYVTDHILWTCSMLR